jgi:sulfite exporter TauE/SafE
VEEPPLQTALLATAAVFSIEHFIDASRALFPRYVRLGGVLMLVYGVSGLLFLMTAFGGPAGERWLVTALVTVLFVAWITAVNLVYLLAQIVIASEDCGVGAALRQVAGFVRRLARTVAGVCLVVLGLVVLATAASLVATTALGLIGFVPFVGLAVLPLQLLAWLLRSLVLQYISLASIGAYSALYRGHARESAEPASPVAVRPMGAEAR